MPSWSNGRIRFGFFNLKNFQLRQWRLNIAVLVLRLSSFKTPGQKDADHVSWWHPMALVAFGGSWWLLNRVNLELISHMQTPHQVTQLEGYRKWKEVRLSGAAGQMLTVAQVDLQDRAQLPLALRRFIQSSNSNGFHVFLKLRLI